MANHQIKQKYNARIIKAGAIVPETKQILDEWDIQLTIKDNLERAVKKNVIGKKSRTRTSEVVTAFRQRYCVREDVLNALCTLEQGGLDQKDMNIILYFIHAQGDPLIHDVVVQYLSKFLLHPEMQVTTMSLVATLGVWQAEGRMTNVWSDITTKRVAEGILSALRDYGIMTGQNKKKMAFPSLSPKAFAFISKLLASQGLTGKELIKSKEWDLLLLSPTQVERRFIEANQLHLLSYNAMGSVIRVDFPIDELGDFAHGLLQ